MDIDTQHDLDQQDAGRIRFSRVLRPHRSSSERAIKIVTGFVLCLFIPTGTIFLINGAWPVFGFMGVEVAGLIFALRYNYKVGSAFEAITISDQEFRLSRVDHWGETCALVIPAAMAAGARRCHIKSTDRRHPRAPCGDWKIPHLR